MFNFLIPVTNCGRVGGGCAVTQLFGDAYRIVAFLLHISVFTQSDKAHVASGKCTWHTFVGTHIWNVCRLPQRWRRVVAVFYNYSTWLLFTYISSAFPCCFHYYYEMHSQCSAVIHAYMQTHLSACVCIFVYKH